MYNLKNTSLMNLIIWFDLSVENMWPFGPTTKLQVLSLTLTFVFGDFPNASFIGILPNELWFRRMFLCVSLDLHILPESSATSLVEDFRSSPEARCFFFNFKNKSRERKLHLKFAIHTRNGVFFKFRTSFFNLLKGSLHKLKVIIFLFLRNNEISKYRNKEQNAWFVY